MAMKTGEPSWRWRRSVIIVVTAYCLWRVGGMIDAKDTVLNQIIAYGLLILAGVLVLGYSSLATVQDVIAIWRTGRALPYAPPPSGDGNPQERNDQ